MSDDVTLSDVIVLARALWVRPLAQRGALAARYIARARCAGRYRRVHGRTHPRFGDGTLSAAVLLDADGPCLQAPAAMSADFAACLIEATQAACALLPAADV